ncbi:hypothetical protein [Hymenobacter metallilatus]|uniref:Uncharacterized protein n=1 Tax=Hymenobacter metallilatus TaxID=2493666 RepID=A0A428JIB4_9BACT|nr:hypothetical protein [Hymenobacter metallilatus]RSK32417.1 hypothetical protein EI290_11850 [Hymenobacter metallilatus]
MKNIVLLSGCLILVNFCNAQTRQYVAHATLSGKPKQLVITDKKDGTKYVLDSARVYITAIDINGKVKWRTDPHSQSKTPMYRVLRPTIVSFNFERCAYCKALKLKEFGKDEEIISVTYSNTQFGYVSKKDGGFIFLGQD